jgi:glutamate formiminotransferase
VAADGRAQVTMNITDFERTPVSRVYQQVKELAARQGTALAETELIGLIPEAAYEPNSEWVRQTKEFDPEQRVLERRLAHPMLWP